MRHVLRDVEHSVQFLYSYKIYIQTYNRNKSETSQKKLHKISNCFVYIFCVELDHRISWYRFSKTINKELGH
jgi:hypothetical protein